MPIHRQLDPSDAPSWGLPRLFAGRRRESAPAPPLDEAVTDRLTGTGTEASWELELGYALADWASLPVTVVRLALASDLSTMNQEDAAAQVDRDLVLSAVRWREILRPADHLARLGASEFAVLLPRCGGTEAEAVIARLTASVPDGAKVAVGSATWDGEESAMSLQIRAEAILDDERAHLDRDPLTDPDRVAAVLATGLAVHRTQAEFDEVARSVAWLLGTPVVVITLFDDTWQHFIGEHGAVSAGGPPEGTPANDAICRQTIATGRPLVVSDTTRHPVLQDVPAARDLGVIACASVPVISADGHVLGSVCAMVQERHAWSADDVALLKTTAARVADRLADVSIAPA